MKHPIYTRTGDSGETSIVGGERVAKNGVRVTAYGTIDEANSHIGLARASLQVAVEEEADLDRVLDFVQHRLFNCSSRLATPDELVDGDTPEVSPEDIARLEQAIDDLSGRVSDLDGFVLPGGPELSARLHVARTVVRRAERCVLDMAAEEPVDADVLAFLNRLSDLLFAMARYAAHIYQGGDVYWDPEI